VPRVARALHRRGLLEPAVGALLATARRGTATVLTYHRVNDDADPFFPSVPTAVFEEHMRHVARVYRVLPLEELAERLSRDDVPARALAITFDDGYRDNLTHAAPVLARFGLPATIFLATGFIGSGVVPWWDRLALAFKNGRRDELSAPGGGRLPLHTRAQRLAALESSLAHLKRLDDDRREAALAAILATLDGPAEAGAKTAMLNWEDVQALVGLGCSIGAHTVNHPVLSRVSPERARAEILGSRAAIAAACGRAPRAFAYPNGQPEDYTETTVELVRAAGFTCAVTTRFGVNTPATSPWELRRGGPWEHDLPTFAVKLAWYRAGGRR
jgi:peptidoglycan/xylan/chitin deacetylase (PgdA/CDA1 family)